MAKVGEGDPRWIVQNRDDGKNVNSWHWEERDLSKATKDAITTMFENASLIGDKESIQAKGFTVKGLKTTEATDISTDVTVAQRKGKIMCYFETKFTVKWSAEVFAGDVATEEGGIKVEGKMTVPEVEHDNFRDNFDVNVSTVDRNPSASAAESYVQTEGRAYLRRVIREYFEKIYADHNVGAKTGSGSTLPSMAVSTAAATASTPAAPTASSAAPVAKKPAPTTASNNKFEWKMNWRCPLVDLFAAFIDERRATGYTRGPCSINPETDGKFTYLGGAISGYFTKVEAEKLLCMQWRLSSWAPDVHASVVIEFIKEEGNMTRFNFAMAGIPDGELDRVKQGWMVNFIDPIKGMFGYSYEWVN